MGGLALNLSYNMKHKKKCVPRKGLNKDKKLLCRHCIALLRGTRTEKIKTFIPVQLSNPQLTLTY